MRTFCLIIFTVLCFGFVRAQRSDSLRYFNGQAIYQGSYTANGLQDGKWLRFFENGKVQEETFYTQGTVIGWKTFYENGQINERFDTLAEGYMHSYYENGTLMRRGKVMQRQKTGTWQLYHPNGKLQAIEHYQMGGPEGEWLVYDSMGNLRERRFYKDAARTGTWQYYTATNVLLYTSTFEEDEEVERKYFYPNGSLQSKGACDNLELMEGPWQAFDSTGALLHAGTYYMGRRQGKWQWFYPDGKVKEEGMYVDDERKGVWLFYNKEGQITMRPDYGD